MASPRRRVGMLVAAGVLLAACGPRTVPQPGAPQAPPGAPLTLNGAGATFPFPLHSKWSQVYAAEKGVQVNYQSIGSGGGIRVFITDPAGSDVYPIAGFTWILVRQERPDAQKGKALAGLTEASPALDQLLGVGWHSLDPG